MQKPWYHDRKFNAYWKHYQEVFSWTLHHKLYTVHQQNDYVTDWQAKSQKYMQLYWSSLQNYYHTHQTSSLNIKCTKDNVFKVPFPPSNVSGRVSQNSSISSRKRPMSRGSEETPHQCKSRNKQRSRSKKRSRAQQRSRSTSNRRHPLNNDDAQYVCDIDMNDDLIKFLAQSAKHRKQRDATKKNTGKMETETEYVENFDVDKKPTNLAPKERPGIRRTAEMKVLYGKGAAMIHGMETAMQLTFDRNCDTKQSKVWPNLPLNIKFD